jgi:hypothetical protein
VHRAAEPRHRLAPRSSSPVGFPASSPSNSSTQKKRRACRAREAGTRAEQMRQCRGVLFPSRWRGAAYECVRPREIWTVLPLSSRSAAAAVDPFIAAALPT